MTKKKSNNVFYSTLTNVSKFKYSSISIVVNKYKTITKEETKLLMDKISLN